MVQGWGDSTAGPQNGLPYLPVTLMLPFSSRVVAPLAVFNTTRPHHMFHPHQGLVVLICEEKQQPCLIMGGKRGGKNTKRVQLRESRFSAWHYSLVPLMHCRQTLLQGTFPPGKSPKIENHVMCIRASNRPTEICDKVTIDHHGCGSKSSANAMVGTLNYTQPGGRACVRLTTHTRQ